MENANIKNRMRNSTETLEWIARIEKQLDRRVAAAYRNETWQSLKEMQGICAYYEEEIRRPNVRLERAQENGEENEAAYYRGTIKTYEDTLQECRKLLNMLFFKKWVYVKHEAYMSRRRFGIYHHFWEVKKRILKDEYGIEWYTPQEEHPDIHFD